MKRIDRRDRRRGRQGSGSIGSGTGRGRRRPGLRPELLPLEDRRLLSTFTVTSDGDSLDNNGNPVSGTLRWAVEQADMLNSPSTIGFNLGSGPQTITLGQLGKPIELSQAITIDGPGASLLTIDGGGDGTAFKVDSGVTATITGLEITNANGGGNGAIQDLGTLNLNSCTITQNPSPGVYDTGTANLNDVTITDGNAFNGAGMVVKGTATLTGCTISDNTAATGCGIWSTGTVTVKGCTITGNSALGGAGGVYSTGHIKLYDSTISDNTGSNAGGLWNDGGTAYLGGCTMSGNSGDAGDALYNSGQITLTDCTFAGDHGGNNGVLQNQGSAVLTGCTITGATCYNNGGALGNVHGATLTVTDSTIEGCTATGVGGALYNGGTATLTDCTISGNTAGSQGGGAGNGMFQPQATLNIIGCTIAGNTSGSGGAGVWDNAIALISDSTLVDNVADQGTSPFDADGGGLNVAGTATVQACTITGNASTGFGGGVYVGGIGTLTLTINGTIVAGNTSTVTGSTEADDIAIAGGTHVSGTYDLIGTGGDGGLGAGSSTNIVGVADPGLAPLGDYGGPTQTVALLAGSPAIGHGGALGVSADQRGFPLDTPNPDIGAFQVQGSSSDLVVNTGDDVDETPAGDLDLRQAIALAGTLGKSSVDITFNASALGTSPTIALTGGPIEFSTSGVAITITAPAGGLTVDAGGASRAFVVDPGAAATLSGLTITGGSTTAGGGALYDDGGTADLVDCTITGNSANAGGGVYGTSPSTLDLGGCTIVGNVAAATGGGLDALGSLSMSESTITGNSATDGGGLGLSGSSTIASCTISGNTASKKGGGLYDTAGTAALEDTIVAGNTGSGGKASDIAGKADTGATGTYDLIGPGGAGGVAGGTGVIVLASDSGLGLGTLGNYGGPTATIPLLPGGPAIGAGTAIVGVTTDQRGKPIDPNGPDIGAFQSQGFTLTPVADSTPQSAATGAAFAAPLAVAVAANNPVEPVAGGVVTFTAPAVGASAGLSGSTVAIGSNGQAQVVATANATTGTYSVTASTAGAASPATFALANLVGLAFGGLGNPTIAYGSSATFTGTLLSAGGQAPTGESVKVSVGGDSGSGQVGADGSFSVTVNTSGLAASGTAYSVAYSYGGDTTFAATTAAGTLTVSPASPTVNVSDPGGTYNGSAFPATDSVAGLGGTAGSSLEGVGLTLAYYSGTYTSPSQLAGVKPIAGAPSQAGSYTVLASFAGSADYAPASALANFSIAKVSPTVDVADAGGSYDGSTFSATATVAGLGGTAGTSLEGVSPTLAYYSGTYTNPSQLEGLTPLPGAPSEAGSYTALASFAGSTDYSASAAVADFDIAQATPNLSVLALSGPYTGSAASVLVSIAGVDGLAGPSLEGVAPTLSYYSGTYTDPSQLDGVTPLAAPPTQVGDYTVEASFVGSTDYAGDAELSSFSITTATPKVSVSDPGGTFGGSIPAATATVAGVSGTAGPSLEGVGLTLAYYTGTYTSAAQLKGLTPIAASPTGVGSYTVLASFAGSTDYTPASALADFAVAPAAPVLAVADAGGTFDGSAFPATATIAGVVPGVDNTPGAQLEGVSFSLAYYSGTYTTASQINGLTPIAGAPSKGGPYTVAESFPGSADYAPASALANFTIAQATATVDVTDAGGTYSGNPFPASATVAGPGGAGGASLEGIAPALSYYTGTYTSTAQLRGLTPMASVPTHAGPFTAVASFPGTADYTPASALVDFTIAQAATQLTWNVPASIVFGTPLSAAQLDASATVAGTSTSVAGTMAYTPGTGAILGAGANQALSVTFTPTDPVDYTTVTTSTTINVAPATPAISVSAPGGTFDGSPYAASVSIRGSAGAAPAASLEDVSPNLTYYAGTGTSGTDLGSMPPSAPGTYTVVASFPGSADYTEAQSAPVTFTITQASAAISLALSSGTAAYGQAVTLTATINGAAGGTVTFFDGGSPLGTAAVGASGQATFTTTALAVGDHAITASYSGAGGQLSATSLTATESVSKAAAQVVLTPQAVFKKKKVISLGLQAKVEPTTGGAAVPTGTVTFEVGKKVKKKVVEQVLGTVALVGGEATLAVKPNKVLKKAITVVYGGDAGFAADSVSVPSLTTSPSAAMARRPGR